MFDLRYHVASLAAVFIALVIGILVGVGIADRGVREEALRQDVAAAEQARDRALEHARFLERQQERTQNFVAESYEALMAGRLDGKGVAIVFVGSVDADIGRSVEAAIGDAGGSVTRMRALRLPIDPAVLRSRVARSGTGRRYAGRDGLADLGRELAGEIVDGGETPLWDALGKELVEEQEGGLERAADAVVVNRTTEPQRGPTAAFLTGFYAGLGDSGVPAVGVETSDTQTTAIGLYARRGLSSVDAVETRTGKLALALLLAGAEEGQYGLRSDDGLMPPIEPLDEPVE